jgi:hypothetical protein
MRRGHPKWNTPEAMQLEKKPSSFEELVIQLQLAPAQFLTSRELHEWVKNNKDTKYVPSDLLKAWGFSIDPE